MKTRKSRFGLKLSAILWLVICVATLFAQGNSADKGKPPFPAIQLPRQLRSEEAIRALEQAVGGCGVVWKNHGRTGEAPASGSKLWVGPSGRLMYACELEAPLAASSTRVQPASFPLDQTFRLHSLPGSNRVLYLDFVGAAVSGTAWNTNCNSCADIIAAPFSLNGDSSSFSTTVPPFTTKWNANKASQGLHLLETKAHDAAGNSGVLASISVKK